MRYGVDYLELQHDFQIFFECESVFRYPPVVQAVAVAILKGYGLGEVMNQYVWMGRMSGCLNSQAQS